MSELVFEPMSVGGILDRSFRLYRQRFVRFLAIVAIIQVPLHLLTLAFTVFITFGLGSMQGSSDSESAAILFAVLGLGWVLFVLLTVVGQQLSTAALLKGVSESYLGRDVSVGQAYRFVVPKLLSLIGSALLVGLIAGLGYMLCVVPGVIFSLWYALTAPSIVLEGHRALGGMARSKQLASGNLGRIFLVFLVVFLITIAFTLVFQMAGQFLAMALLAQQPLAAMALQQLLQMIPAILIMPIGAAATALLYYDLRIRKEGFDLEMLAERLSAQEATGSDEPTL